MVFPGEVATDETLTPLEGDRKSPGSTLEGLMVFVSSGMALESEVVVLTPMELETLKLEGTKPNGSGVFVFRGLSFEVMISAPLELVATVFRPWVADSVRLTWEEIPEVASADFEVEKTIVFAPKRAKSISLAPFSIPALSAIISSSFTLAADELPRGVVCVNEVSRVLVCDLAMVDSVVNRVALSANALPDNLMSSD